MEQKKKDKMLEIIQEIRDFGLGKITINVMRDGKLHIVQERHKLNPTKLDIETAIDDTVRYGFGGVDLGDGEWTLLKQTRSIRF